MFDFFAEIETIITPVCSEDLLKRGPLHLVPTLQTYVLQAMFSVGARRYVQRLRFPFGHAS